MPNTPYLRLKKESSDSLSNLGNSRKEKLTNLKFPRTPMDYRLLTQLIWQGKTTDQISKYMTLREWRSEVIQVPNDCGHLCAECLRLISCNDCVECGMTFFAGETGQQ